MRRRWSIGFVLGVFLLIPLFGASYEVGQKVEVEWHGTWYPAVVIEAGQGQWKIHYDGYGDDWDEWVGPDRIKASGAKPARQVAEAPKAASPAQSGAGGGGEITIRQGGSIWASVSANGTIRVQGSIVGEIGNDGTVRKSGSIVGEVESNGTIRKSGMIVGEIESGGTLRRSGMIIGAIEGDGTLRKDGSIWGSASSCCGSHAAKRKVAAVLVFFSGEFGF